VSCAIETRKAIRRVTINGVRVYPAYTVESWPAGTLYPGPFGVLTFRNLGYPLDRVKSEGFNLCMVMAASSPCGTPDGLCFGNGGCTYSVFNHVNDCCPLTTVPTVYLVG
jgi:hypothetical protein